MAPWNSFNDHARALFGVRVHRVALDAGFTCPNRDGTKARGGCIYCDVNGSRAAYQDPDLTIAEQMRTGMKRLESRFGARRFIAYFQAYTNTYAPVEKLRALYDESFVDDRVVGLSIGTRPDCIDEPVLDLLAEFNSRTHLWVELGFQSMKESTLEFINRAETLDDFVRAVEGCHARGIRVCAHAILGMPGDTLAESVKAAPLFARLGVEGVKLHNLYISDQMPLYSMYKRGKLPPLPTREEYASAAADFLELLPWECTIHRLTGEAPYGHLIAPDWAADKNATTNAIEAELTRRGTRQGSRTAPKQ